MRNLKLTVAQYEIIRDLVRWEKEENLHYWQEEIEDCKHTIKIYRQLFSKLGLDWEEN